MRARYYNVNIKRFINQDVVHGSINLSQSLNRYSYVQGNPIKLTDPFGLSPLDKINWRNVGHSALNIQGCINGYGFIFDGINAVWYACEGDIYPGSNIRFRKCKSHIQKCQKRKTTID